MSSRAGRRGIFAFPIESLGGEDLARRFRARETTCRDRELPFASSARGQFHRTLGAGASVSAKRPPAREGAGRLGDGQPREHSLGRRVTILTCHPRRDSESRIRDLGREGPSLRRHMRDERADEGLFATLDV